jgi:hypothetical protein
MNTERYLKIRFILNSLLHLCLDGRYELAIISRAVVMAR